jgi:hypothetical protein
MGPETVHMGNEPVFLGCPARGLVSVVTELSGPLMKILICVTQIPGLWIARQKTLYQSGKSQDQRCIPHINHFNDVTPVHGNRTRPCLREGTGSLLYLCNCMPAIGSVGGVGKHTKQEVII